MMRFRRIVALLMVVAIGFAPTASASTQQATPLPNTAATSAPTQSPAVSAQATASTQTSAPTQTTTTAPSSVSTIIPDVTEAPTPDPSIPTPVPPPAPLPADTPSAVPTPTATPEATPIEDSTTTEAPTAIPTATPTEEASTPAETPTAAPTATPTAAPAVFDDTVRFTVSLTCEGASEAATAVAVLQRKAGDKWEAIPDPAKPEQDYTVAFSSGTQAEFVMPGLLADDEYRARLVSYGGMDADSLSVAYRDGKPNELQTEITVTIKQSEQPTNSPSETVAPSVEPSLEPSPSFDPDATPTPEPTTEPAVYGESDFYAFTISLNTVTDDGTVTVSLLDADEQPLDTATLTIEESLIASASFSLAQKPIDGLYTARVTALGSLSVTDAHVLGATLRYEDGELTTAAYVEGLPALDMPMMLMANDLQPTLKAADGSWQLDISTSMIGSTQSTDVSVTITLSSSPTTDVLVCQATSDSADITNISTTESEATLTVTPNGIDGISYNVSVTQDGSCTVTMNPVAGKYRADGSAEASASLSGGSARVAFSAMPLTSFEGTINWNDNHSKARPTPELTLEYSEEGSDTWSSLSQAEYTAQETYNYSTYIFANLDMYSSSAKLLTYSFKENEESVPTYIVEHKPDGTIVNTLSTNFSISKVWYDNFNKIGERQALADWMDSITFIRISRGNQADITDEYVKNENLTETDKSDNTTWELTVNKLPAYDEEGFPYTYKVVEPAQPAPDSDSVDHYETVTENVNEYAQYTDAAYNGGRFASTLTAKEEFTFTKVWKDGEDIDARPSVVFYLYRYAQDSGYTFETASPVQGMDTMTLGAKSANHTFTYTYKVGSETKLPRYDEQGRPYVYFLVERIGSNGRDYVSIVDNTYAVALSDSTKINTNQEAAQRGYILNRGTVTNISRATVAPSVTKTWYAKAAQGMQASVTMGLYRNLPDEDPQPVLDDSNTPVTLLMSGFTAERMTQTMSFPAQQKYDDDGYQYEYTIKEISATVDGSTATPEAGKTFFEENDVFSDGTHSFRVNYGEDGSTVTNTLVGDTQLRVRKVWSEPLPVGVTGTIDIVLLRDDEPFTAYNPTDDSSDVVVTSTTAQVTITADGDIAIANDNSIEIVGGASDGTNGGNFEVLFSGLPRFDENGAECTYTVREVGVLVSNNDEYKYDGLEYSVEDGIKTATITNVNGEKGSALTFEVTKIWLDDNDLLHRIPVHVEIYYTGGGGEEKVAQTVLTANGSWFKRITVALDATQAADDKRKDYSNYIAKEVTYTTDGNSDLYMTVGTYSNVEGVLHADVQTKEHLYKATVEKNDYQFTITNLRVGTLSISVTKTWAVGYLSGFTARFQLIKNGEYVANNDAEPSLDGVKEISQQAGGAITFENLDKYDDVGALIPYSVAETALQQQEDENTWVDFEGGALDWNGDIIVSQCLRASYEIGETQHTKDTMEYAFQNACSEKVELYVNKVWRDEGNATAMATRPDIVLRVERFHEVNGVMEKDTHFTLNERIWDTTLNNWFWRCNFGMVDRYDSDGNEYEYRVTEDIVQQSSSKYIQSYYNGTSENGSVVMDEPVVGDRLDTSMTTEDVFYQDATAGATYTIAGFWGNPDKKAGTIINTIHGRMIFRGTKIWENLPSWFDKTQLPTIYAQLYRSTDGSTDLYNATTIVKDADGNDLEAAIAGGQTAYRIPSDADETTDQALLLPLYTEYGHPYTYYVREEDDSGNILTLDGYGTVSVSGSVITNTYVSVSEGDPPPNPAVTIEIAKEWSETVHPAAVFTLYSEYANADNLYTGENRRAIGTYTLASDATAPLTITVSSSNEPLLYYAPNGSVYHYSVEEEPLNGYVATYDDATTAEYQPVPSGAITISLTGDAASGYTGSVAFKNTYDGNTNHNGNDGENKLVATKVWQDGGNTYQTRPIIVGGAVSGISFTLYRNDVDITDKVDASWAVHSSDSNTWLCTFIPKDDTFPLYKYDTNGKAYTYRVEETLGEPYSKHYTPGYNGMRVANRLNSVALYVNKVWSDSDGVLTNQELMDLHAIGAVESLTFSVWRKIAREPDWTQVTIPATALPTPNTSGNVTIAWADLLSAKQNNKYLLIATDLPAQDDNGVDYLYWVQEEDVDPATTAFTVTNPEPTTVQTTFTITNTFATKKLYFVKDWQDDTNREHIRPSSLTITVTPSGVPGTTITENPTKTLSKSTTITDSDIANVLDSATDGTRWVGEMTVLSSTNCSYSAKETIPSGYTASNTDGSLTQATDSVTVGGKSYTWFSITNKHSSHTDTKTINITATKAWSDDSNAYGDRATKVTFKLQRRLKTTSTWVDVPEYGTAGAIDCLPEGVSCSQTLSASDATWTGVTPATWSSLLVYQSKTHSDHDPQTYVYRVVETHVNDTPISNYYTYAASPATVDASAATVDSTTNITITNTPAATELTAKKTWNDGALTTYRTPITVHLQRRLAASTNDADWLAVSYKGAPVTYELTAGNEWQHKFTSLPKYNSAQQEYAYRAVEDDPPAGYINTSQTVTDGTAEITNTLHLINVSVKKTWADQNGTAFDAAKLPTIMKTLNKLGGLPDITFRVERKVSSVSETDVWDQVASKTYTAAEIATKPQDNVYEVAKELPVFHPTTKAKYEYRVVETVSDQTGITLPSAVLITTAVANETVTTNIDHIVSLTNQIAVRTLYFVKNWDDSINSDGTRPDSLTIDVTRDDKSIPVTLSATTTSSDPKATIAAATHGTATDGSRWFGELTVPYSGTYSAAENNVPTLYTLSVSEHDQEPVPNAPGYYDWWSFTNTHARNVFGISVTKAWADDDKAVAFGDRPTSILVKLQRTTTPATEASWADLSALSPDVPTGFVAQKELTQSSSWTNGWQGLYARQTKQSPTDPVKGYSYRVVEASVTGYSTSVVYNGGSAQYINGAETTTTATAALTNTLETVDLTVLITWTDPPSTTARPNGINVQLQRRPVGSSDTMWTNVTTTDRENAPVTSLVSKEDWKDFTTFLRLPKATPTGHLYEYRVVQTDLPECYTEVTTFDRSQENLTAQTIHNSFSQGLEIDNTTKNPATSKTDAGGFVGINTVTPTQRDIDPYRTDERSVSWQPDVNWQHKNGLQVTYREDSATEWVTVTIENVANLSTLRTRFPGATLTSNGDIRTLTLAQDVSTMPYQTRVLVEFEPTLAVENTTTANAGGAVEINTWSTEADGTGTRYTAFTARGRADTSWMVDMNRIQISAPYGVNDDYSHNTTATTIRPDRNGNFTANVSVLIAGAMQTVPISGRVTVLSRDRYSNPTEVSVTISPMEFPLDVGLAFKAAAVPGNTPATGDPIDWVLMALLVSGLNLVLASICRRHRKRAQQQ